MSRQLDWQRKKISLGRCPRCGGSRITSLALCLECTEKSRTYAREAYRKKVGIPLDRPTRGLGRPRKVLIREFGQEEWS